MSPHSILSAIFKKLLLVKMLDTENYHHNTIQKNSTTEKITNLPLFFLYHQKYPNYKNRTKSWISLEQQIFLPMLIAQ